MFVRRHRSLDLNVGLVVGTGHCLVVDTRMSHRQGRELAAAIRVITAHPWTVVNTHAHFDHYFGNAVFRPAEIWGHVRCAAAAREHGAAHRAIALRYARAEDTDANADALSEVEIDPPDRTFINTATLDVGGRAVRLRHLGRGHTDNDVVVEVPDAAVVFAGDLVEEGAPPDFGDSFPLDWPSTVDGLLTLVRDVDGPVVPGHGDVVDLAFVATQGAKLAQVAELARTAYAEGRTVDQSWPDLPYPEEPARDALTRAYHQLAATRRDDPV